MNLKEAKADVQVKFLKVVLKGGPDSLACFLATAAVRHYHITKNYSGSSAKPVVRWYMGQLARENIRKVYKEARLNLENLAGAGPLDVSEWNGNAGKEFYLYESLYPALKDTLESGFACRTNYFPFLVFLLFSSTIHSNLNIGLIRIRFISTIEK